jgi:2-oxo-4-hydroxy-4-carboxy-5-ureidoimidazoline decarboxylase
MKHTNEMTLTQLNNLPSQQLKDELFKCCGSSQWVEKMTAIFPVDNEAKLLEEATRQWYLCTEADWREAFTHHPKIGDKDSIKKKFASTAQWAAGEQSGVNQASDETINALAEGNKKYEEKFGYIFIVCATGKSADEMLDILNSRLLNNTGEEIKIAMEEQNKITLLRLKKLLNS